MLCLPKNFKTFDTISGSLMDLYAITIRKTITASNLILSGATSLSRAAIKNKMLRIIVRLFLPSPSEILLFDILLYIIPAKKERR